MTEVTESVLQRVFREDPVTKIIDTLMDHPTHEYTKKEVAEVNDMSRVTLHRHWERIEELGLAKQSRKIGNTTLYVVDQQAPIIKSLYKFEELVMEEEADTHA